MILEETPEAMMAQKQAALIDYRGPDEVVHFTDFLTVKASERFAHKTFDSSFAVFNEKIDGLQTGEVVVISGYTKNGKTLFAESWIKSIVVKDPSAKTALFSFEVQTERMLAKFKEDVTLPLYVPMELKTMDFEWLKDKCLEAKLKHDCRIVMIDHLHFLVDMNTKQNMSLNIGAFMRKLKHEIAIGLDLAVIIIAHQGQPKDGNEASLGGIRDSSFISQEADTVILVSRRENMNAVEIQDFMFKYGEEKTERILPPPLLEDKYSAGLAIVKIACTRRSGVYDFKKLFKKNGEFLEEI